MNALITPQLRRTSEIPFHSDRAPGDRFVFVGRVLDPVCKLYVVGRRVEDIAADQPGWLDDHRHNCPTFYVLLGRNPDLTGLAAEVVIEGTAFLAEAPVAVLLPTAALHHHRLVRGGGWSFHVNVRPDYVESLLDLPDQPLRGVRVPEVCRTAEPRSGTVRAWEEKEGAFDPGWPAGSGPLLWKVISPDDFQDPGLRLHVHQFGPGVRAGFGEAPHRQATDGAYIFLPAFGRSLEVEVTADGAAGRVRDLGTAYHPAGSTHAYRHLAGEGLVLKFLRLGGR
jgi:hypothetical protein